METRTKKTAVPKNSRSAERLLHLAVDALTPTWRAADRKNLVEHVAEVVAVVAAMTGRSARQTTVDLASEVERALGEVVEPETIRKAMARAPRNKAAKAEALEAEQEYTDMLFQAEVERYLGEGQMPLNEYCQQQYNPLKHWPRGPDLAPRLAPKKERARLLKDAASARSAPQRKRSSRG